MFSRTLALSDHWRYPNNYFKQMSAARARLREGQPTRRWCRRWAVEAGSSVIFDHAQPFDYKSNPTVL